MPKPVRRGAELRPVLKRCAERLSHAAALATFAADGPEPQGGASYILDTLDDLERDLHALRLAAPRPR